MIRVAVFGAGGRMGSAACRAVAEDADTELVAAVDPGVAGRAALDDGPSGIAIVAFADEIDSARADVAVDFTVAPAAMENLRWCAKKGVHAVVGTTGFTPTDINELEKLFGGGSANCLIAPNFSVGAVLMMRFAEIAARHMDSAEVIELHHDRKADAPSGTSMETARRISLSRLAVGRGEPADPTRSTVLPGARGGVTEGGIHIHSVRLPGLLAHQEVILGAPGETLSVRHDSTDRSSFMPGVLMAVKAVGARAGLTVGIDSLLGID